MNHLGSVQETINKQGEEIGVRMRDNAKLEVLIIENENLKRMVIKPKGQRLKKAIKLSWK